MDLILKKMINISLSFILISIGNQTFLNMVFAEPVALIITVGTYKNPQVKRLEGTSRDALSISQLAKRFGIQKHFFLKDQDVTLNNIREHFLKIKKILGKNDSVWVYFSGHGMQVPDRDGDEPDGFDEAWLMHDMNIEGNTITNILLDDELTSLMHSLPSNDQWLIVDSCHSGSISRGIEITENFLGRIQFNSKSTTIHEISSGTQNIDDIFTEKFAVVGNQGKKSDHRLVVLSAAQDNEESLDSPQGGVFTNSLIEIAQSANCEDLTAESLIKNIRIDVLDYLQKKDVSKFKYFTPQLTSQSHGKKRNISKYCRTKLKLNPQSHQHPRWHKLQKLTQDNQCAGFKLSSNQQIYYHRGGNGQGDRIQFSIQVHQKGYLNLLELDEQGNSTILYPNKYHPENIVIAENTIELPSKEMHKNEFVFAATPPTAKSLIVAVWSQEPTNLYQNGKTIIGSNGEEFELKKASNQMMVSLDYTLESKAFKIVDQKNNKPSTNSICTSSTIIEVRK